MSHSQKNLWYRCPKISTVFLYPAALVPANCWWSRYHLILYKVVSILTPLYYQNKILHVALSILLLICDEKGLWAQKTGNAYDASFVLEYNNSSHQIIKNGVVYVGDTVTGKIVFNEKNWDQKKRYCYIVFYSEGYTDFTLLYPNPGTAAPDHKFPFSYAGGIENEIHLFEALITYPLRKENYVAIFTEYPISNSELLFNTDNSRYSSGESSKVELLKFLKGSKLSTFYSPSFGDIIIKTLQIETRPSEERNSLVKSSAIVGFDSKEKRNLFVFNDSAEIFYTRTPQTDIVRDSFPTVDIIDPSFDTTTTRGVELLKSKDAKKVLIRGIAVDRQRGIKQITINNYPPTTYRESSGFFDYLYELKNGVNILNVAIENNKGFKRTVRLKFQYTAKEEKIEIEGRNYLLVIGIDKYINWPILRNPTNDAKAFKQIMIENYGYQKENVIELFDEKATRKNFYFQLKKLVDSLTENDKLLVYYAGHGYYDEKLDLGYWIPVNAEKNEYDEYLNNLDIARYIQKMKAKNIFVIADACYSGSLIRDMQHENSKDYKSRIILCAGKLQPVSDGLPGAHSPFASGVLQFLSKKSSNPVLASDLIQYVKLTVKQTPIGGALDEVGDENGDFIFERSK